LPASGVALRASSSHASPPLRTRLRAGRIGFTKSKHDGYRILACKSGDTVRLWSRNGRDWSREFLAVTDALRASKHDDIVLDGEAMAHCTDGLPDFHGLRSEDGRAAACRSHSTCFAWMAKTWRPLPLEERRARLRRALRSSGKTLRFSEHLEGDGPEIYRLRARSGWRASSLSDATAATGLAAISRG